MAAVSLADVKAFLNITGTSNDDELMLMIDRAEAILAKRIGPLEPTTVAGEVHTGPGPIVLRRLPVLSATTATYSGATVTDLDLDAETGLLYGTFGTAARKVLVTYVAGFDPLPADLEEAVLELVKHLWISQRGAAQSPLAQQQGEDVQPSAGFLLPYRVQSLIEPYLSPTVA